MMMAMEIRPMDLDEIKGTLADVLVRCVEIEYITDDDYFDEVITDADYIRLTE